MYKILSVKKAFTLIIGCLMCLISWSQTNPALVTIDLPQGVIFKDTIVSSLPPTQVPPYHNPINTPGISGFGNDEYEFSFLPNPQFLGKDVVNVKYFSGTAGQATPKYIRYEINYKTSIVTAKDDFVVYEAGSDLVAINVLENDVTSSSGLAEVMIAQVSNGTATVNENNLIEFVPDDESRPIFIEYVAIDDQGNSDLATVVLQADNVQPQDTLRFTIVNNRPFEVILPNETCTIVDSTDFGELELVGSMMSYKPDAYSQGSDETTLSDGNATTVVVFNVIDNTPSDDFVQDDYVFTPMNTSVDLDVFANDFDPQDEFIVDHSADMIHDTLGKFSYTPPQWSQGTRFFYYTAYNGFENQTARVYITVDNFVPQSLSGHQITGLKNSAIVLDYQVPIDGYSFEVLNAPSNGQLQVDVDSIAVDCNEINSGGLIVYQPGVDYVGLDEFDLRYKVNGNTAGVIKVKVNVVDFTDDTVCPCIGPDCVWPGDVNNDGRVFVDDLLPIGLYMGEIGANRSDITYNHWNGQSSDDWETSQGEIGENLKFIDANGNGFIEASDVDAITENYNGAHNLFANKILGTKAYGLSLVNLNGVDTVYAGETLCLGISIGSEIFPVKDMHGLAFNLNIRPEAIDSSSLDLSFVENSWLTYNSAQIELVQQPYDGIIHAAVSRSDGMAMAGNGIIGQACFIVEEDLGGIRSGEELNTVKIGSSNVSSLDSKGNAFRLTDGEIEIPLGGIRPENHPITPQDLILFPNPTSGQVNIHMNGGSIDDLIISDLSGAQILRRADSESNQLSYDASALNPGTYVASVRSNGRWVSKMFYVLK